MPAILPSHQGFVLPLKLWRPSWFDGVALAVGAASPDIAYLLDGSGLPVWPLSHRWLGLVLWCLPVTVTLCRLLRRAAPVVAAHLPEGGVLALRDYGALGSVAHRWWVTGSSAAVGGASHIAVDQVDLWTRPAEWTGHIAGAVAGVSLVVHIGRRRMIMRWHGPAPCARRRPVLFWSVAGTVAVVGVALLPVLPASFLWHTTGVRLVAIGVLALLAGALCVGRGQHPRSPDVARCADDEDAVLHGDQR